MNKNIVVVGCGNWGKNHVRVFSELGVLYGFYDTDWKKSDAIADKYKAMMFSSYELILNTDQVDAVVIATPAVTHYDLAKQAILAGKDVFVEKPLTMNYEEGKELVDLAKSKGRILMVGHLLMYHSAVQMLLNMVFEGKLGKINYIYSNRLNLGRLRIEENVLQSFAPHDISVILALMGEEPIRVTSHSGVFITDGISDTSLTFMEFLSGAKAHIFVSWLHPYKEQKLIIVGSEAMVVFDDLSAEKVRIYPHKIKWESGKIPTVEQVGVGIYGKYELIPELLGKCPEPLKSECEHFLDCIETRGKPITDGEQALAVLRVLDRCHSLRSRSEGHFFVHESSFVDEDVIVGKGTKIWHFSHIMKGSRIGENCNIGQNVVIGPNVVIGNNVKIQNNVSVYEGVTLEDGVFCGPSCVFTNVINPRSHIERKNEFKKTLVEQGATIGANATILCGVTIGRYAFVGAGAVVTKDVPGNNLVYGEAAKARGYIRNDGGKG